MNQPRTHSIIETVTTIISGYVINFAAQLFLFREADFTLEKHLHISLVFMVLAFVRVYIIRRIFNKVTK